MAEEQAQGTGEPWRRLSPIAVVHFAAQVLSPIVQNIANLVPLLVLFYTLASRRPELVLPLLLAGLLLAAGLAALRFYHYRYRIGDDHLEVRSGVLAKAHSNLPFERIQNIELQQPLYYRPTGHVCMRIDTAGSSTREVVIAGLRQDAARRIKQHILERRQRADAPPQSDSGDAGEDAVMVRREPSDLAIHGAINNSVFWLAAMLSPFYGRMVPELMQMPERMGLDLQQLVASGNWWLPVAAMLALVLLVLAVFVLSLLSAIGAMVRYGGYALRRTDDDRYQCRHGLLNRRELSMQHSRLQMLRCKQGWLGAILDRIDMHLEHGSRHASGPGQAQDSNILIPAVSERQCRRLLGDIYAENAMHSVPMHPISNWFVVRNIVLWVLVPVLLAGGWLAWRGGSLAPMSYLSIPAALAAALVVLRWRRWGLGWDDRFVYVRSGLVGTVWRIFPIHKVQRSAFVQSRMMERRGLASARLMLACGAVTIPCLPQSLARRLIDDALHRVQSSGQSWM